MEKRSKKVNLDDETLNATQAGKMYGVSSWAMYQRARRGQVPFHRIGKRIYFLKSELLAYTIAL